MTTTAELVRTTTRAPSAPTREPSPPTREHAPSPADLLRPAPNAPRRAAAIMALLDTVVAQLPEPLEVALSDGRVLRSRGAGKAGSTARAPRLTIRDPDAFAARIAAGGKVGLGEAHMAGEWESDDLADVLASLAASIDRIPAWVWRLTRRLGGGRPPEQPNTLDGAAENISHHYDLSNELFALFLDESMTYSSAVYHRGDSLEIAQARKRLMLLDDLAVGRGDHLLEIGTGWGTMAVEAARVTGCRVTTITLSEEQAAHARELVDQRGLSDRVDVVVADYRSIRGRYDAIVSVEMLEAVGEDWWMTYFARIEELLAPDGRAAVQTITMTHDRWRAARGGHGWIHRYIFPGGEIPSLAALDGPIRAAGLAVAGRREIGDSYVETLREWRRRFLSRLPDVRALGFDDTFIRMWEFYLAYCEAGFRTGRLGVSQLLLGRP